MDKECKCRSVKNIHTVIYQPGNAESILKCDECGKLWYNILFERMSFSGVDDLDSYQVPITEVEYKKIKETEFKDLSLGFLKGRAARVEHSGGVSEITSDLALERCGRAT